MVSLYVLNIFLLISKQVKNLYKWTSIIRWEMEYLQWMENTHSQKTNITDARQSRKSIGIIDKSECFSYNSLIFSKYLKWAKTEQKPLYIHIYTYPDKTTNPANKPYIAWKKNTNPAKKPYIYPETKTWKSWKETLNILKRKPEKKPPKVWKMK